jgi:hypothetical protein
MRSSLEHHHSEAELMRIFRDRRGDWPQLFLILLFALLLIVGLLLLTVEAKKLKVMRPQLQMDLMDQRASAYLVSLMRTRAGDLDALGGGVEIADLIIMHQDQTRDLQLYDTITSVIPTDSIVEMTIAYPDRTITMKNYKVANNLPTDRYGHSQVLLPGRGGQITIDLWLGSVYNYAMYPDRTPKLNWEMST